MKYISIFLKFFFLFIHLLFFSSRLFEFLFIRKSQLFHSFIYLFFFFCEFLLHNNFYNMHFVFCFRTVTLIHPPYYFDSHYIIFLSWFKRMYSQSSLKKFEFYFVNLTLFSRGFLVLHRI